MPERNVRSDKIPTIRKLIHELLVHGEYTSKSISKILGIKEKDVLDDLPHIKKSLGHGQEIITQPARCLGCGFVFRKRDRVSSPGRCPVCRSEAISPPVFGIKQRDNH